MRRQLLKAAPETTMPGKTAILSDPHGNSPALRAVLDDVHSAGCTKVFVLGDIINGVDPEGCLELLRGWDGITCIKGNAESSVLTPDLDVFPLREDSFYPHVIRLVRWWGERIPEAYLGMLEAMPEHVIAKGACFVHDDPIDRFSPERVAVEGVDAKYWGLCYHARGIREKNLEARKNELLAFMESRGLTRLFFGHTHEPFARTMEGKLICNVGSAGMPLDGSPRPSWALCELGEGAGLDVEFRRVEYDIDETMLMIDALDPDCAFFGGGRTKETYKQMLKTGRHWKVHTKQRYVWP